MSELTLLPCQSEWAQMIAMGSALVKSGFLPPSIKTAEQAVAIMLKGRELGIPPMQAFAQISVISGKPAMGAELMLARIYQRYPNADIQTVKREADGCHIRARRSPQREYVDFRFEAADAKRADVLGKDSWRRYPKAMYYWRCVTDMARATWPEALAGMTHSAEELGAEVDEEGNVVAIPDARPAPKVTAAETIDATPIESEAPPKLAPALQPARKTASVYTGEGDQELIIQGILVKRNIPEMYWLAIHEKMKGRPSSDLSQIISEVTA